MYLKTLRIKNFRAINGDNNLIKFDGNKILFIFGKNNIGKSSILHAYQYFSSPNQSSLITDFYQNDPKNNITIEAVFIKEEMDHENFESKGLNKWVCTETNEVKFKKTWVKADSLAHKETFDPITKKYVDKGFGGIDTILTNALPNIIFIEAMPNIKTLTDWLEKEIKNKIIKRLKECHSQEYTTALEAIKCLQEKVEKENYLDTLCGSANKYFQKTFPELELQIKTTPHKEADLSKAFEKDFSITINNKQSNDEQQLVAAIETLEGLTNQENSGRQFDLHGHGLIRQAIINILGIFKETKENQKHIILFEEPELYLHPSNKRKFRETLYEIADQENYQIICVSHDPQLIDLTKPHTSLVRFVKSENGETQVYQAGENIFAKDDEIKSQVQMLNRFNPHMCETFFSDEVILVEGDTEAIVVRELLNNLSPAHDIFVVNTGSKNNIPFFISVLSHFKIKQHIIHDSDERFLYEKNGSRKKNIDGSEKQNSAWTLNSKIWEEIEKSNEKGVFSKRYVLIRNFEHSHEYTYDEKKGKPLSAHEFARKLDVNDTSKPIVNFLHQILGITPQNEEHSPDYLDKEVIEPNKDTKS